MQELFDEVLNQFQSTNQYDKYIKEVQKEYDVKIYRLHTFSREYANTIRNELNQKYGNEEYCELPQGWHQNQRRLYVWFIVCFIHLKMLEPNKFVDEKRYQKYWKNIRITFFGKDIPFLKYQLLTLLKNKGRTSWKKRQDELLLQAHQSFEKGQWNEVAKFFYFQSRGEFFKTPKQCRQRYQNHLDSKIKKCEWSREEDKILFEHVKKNGPRWAQIISLLGHSRTQHMIKNRYKSIINKIMHDNNMNQGEAVVEALKNCTFSQIKHFEQNIMRDEQGILQVQSEEYIDEPVEDPPVIEHRKRKEKKRGRPKKIKEPEVALKESQPIIVGGQRIPSKNSSFRNSRNSFGNGEIKLDQFNPSMGLNSFSKRNPHVFEQFSNSFNNNSRNQFFSSAHLNLSNCFSYRNEEDRNSLFDPVQSRILKNPNDNFQSLKFSGDSLNRSKRMFFKGGNDSLISSLFK